jgi:DNA-binding SARP family transcriptional activator/predicted ATPase
MTSAGPQQQIAVALLGDFSVRVNGAAIDAQRWKLKHPRLLWQMLCLAPGHRVSRDEAAEALWPQAGVQASSNRLHHTLHTLRRLFNEAGLSDARRLVQLQAGTLGLDPGLALDLDVQCFAQAVAAARACNGSGDALLHLENARAVHRGAFVVPAAAGEWFTPHRQALLRDQVWVLEQLTQRYQAAGRLDDAVQVGQALVQAEPGNEAAHRRLIELYQAQDQPDLAAQQYTACSRHLRRHLGVEPSAATRQLVERMAEQASRRRLQEARAAAANATLGNAAHRRFTAPPRATPLLGRDAELAELQHALLQNQGSRLITIVAAGGIGKTRLAAALAEQVQDHFADGVRFIALGDVQQPSRLAERVCQALALSSAAQTADQVLANSLAQRQLLLVLDRFEHLAAAAPQLAQWLQAAPRLHIVVTSQCTLKSRVEQVYELLPLWLRCEAAAVELFVRTAAHAGVQVDQPQHEPLIRRVCERLGGNALAIELAAAQLPWVPLAALPDMLQKPLQLRVEKSSDDEPQHASLQATIGWSVSLLAAGEARLLALLSVFAGGFSADDVQAVLGTFFDTITLQPLLRTLLDRHLLTRSAEPAEPAPRRFSMPDAIHDFAHRRAQADPGWPRWRCAHAQHFSALARQAFDAIQKGQTGQALAIFRAAAIDIEQALQWMRRHAEAEAYLGLCWQHAALRLTLGHVREAIDGLEEAVRMPAQSRGERDHSAWCHYALSRARAWGGDYAAALKPLQQAHRLARGSADEVLQERVARYQASLWISQLRIEEALKLLDSLIRRSQRLGRMDWLASHYLMLAACFEARCQLERAAAATERSIDCANQAQHPHSTMLALLSLANLDTERGALNQAEESLRESRLLSDVAYSPVLIIHLSLGLGVLAFERCRFADCGEHFEQALSFCQTHLAGRTVIARLWQEFVLMETGRTGGVSLLLRLTEQEMPFDNDFSLTYVRARTYKLQLQAQRGDWPGAQATCAELQALLQRTDHALWASWFAEAAAVAAQHLGQARLAAQFVAKSKRLQADRGIVPTPRQSASWARVDALVREQRTVPCAGPCAGDGARLLPYLAALLPEPTPGLDRSGVDARLDELLPLRPAPPSAASS